LLTLHFLLEQAEMGFLEFSPSEAQGLCPAVSLTRASTLGVSFNLGQEAFRFEPFLDASAGGKVAIRGVAPPAPTTPGKGGGDKGSR
jgi:hypothetical protein